MRAVNVIRWIVVSALILLLAVPAAAVYLGHRTIVEVEGESMKPTYEVGDVVVIRPVQPADLVVGAVVTAISPQNTLYTHRIESIDANGAMQLKGDGNVSNDPGTVTASKIRGVVAHHFTQPYAGLLVQLQQWPLRICMLVVIIGLALMPLGKSHRTPSRASVSAKAEKRGRAKAPTPGPRRAPFGDESLPTEPDHVPAISLAHDSRERSHRSSKGRRRAEPQRRHSSSQASVAELRAPSPVSSPTPVVSVVHATASVAASSNAFDSSVPDDWTTPPSPAMVKAALEQFDHADVEVNASPVSMPAPIVSLVPHFDAPLSEPLAYIPAEDAVWNGDYLSPRMAAVKSTPAQGKHRVGGFQLDQDDDDAIDAIDDARTLATDASDARTDQKGYSVNAITDADGRPVIQILIDLGEVVGSVQRSDVRSSQPTSLGSHPTRRSTAAARDRSWKAS